MELPCEFDFKRPDYTAVYRARMERLKAIREGEQKEKGSVIPYLRQYYRDNPGQLTMDWGVTLDPRKVALGLPADIPFILFPKQQDWVEWLMGQWHDRSPGLVDKSREMGVTWLAVAISCEMCLLNDSVTVGFGSRKSGYVDKKGDMKAILPKARYFIKHLPIEFRGTWKETVHSKNMQIQFPETKSVITGESGDGIGRGDRTSIYFVDESAWIPRPDLVEASLSDTTECRIDISTPHGMNNPFARKRHGGKVSVFTFHWRDDPRKDQAWYDKKCRDIDDPVVIAQELDLSYLASMEGVIIPNAWVQAAVDSHLVLGVTPSGKRVGAMDVADEGEDKVAIGSRLGILLDFMDEWSGTNGDIFNSTQKTIDAADTLGVSNIIYDADGLGASVRGDARIINSRRKSAGVGEVLFTPFRGSGAVIMPTGDPFRMPHEANDPNREQARCNDDYFANFKAQAWFQFRRRFQITYRAVVEGQPFNKDDIISISSTIPEHGRLLTEISQPTFSENGAGKIVVNKMGKGGKSPNLADMAMMLFATLKTPVVGAWSSR